jgi:hypothetical protein
MKRFAVLAAVLGLVLASSALPSGAGEPIAVMGATPNPATTEEEIVISNASDEDSTCEGGVVNLFVEDESSGTVFDDFVEPDGDGNWSQTLGPLPVGTYLAEADCDFGPNEPVGLTPTAEPFFAYADIEFSVVQAPPPTEPTSSTTSSVAASDATRPTFTG